VTGHEGADHVNDHVKKSDRDSTPSSRIVSARLEKTKEQLLRRVVTGQPRRGNKVRSRRGKTVFTLESLAIERIGELIELNDGVTEFATFKTSIKVVIADARGIVDFSRPLGRTSGSHESDRIDRLCLEKPQSMNRTGKFIFSVIVVFCLSSDLCHVFGSNIKDDVGDGF